MEEIRPFQLQSFEDEAQALVVEARVRAGEIVREAQAQREAVLAEARRAGFEQGRHEGLDAGAREARARVAAESAGLQDLLARTARSVEEKRESLAAEAERDLVRLAMAVAGKIVRAEVEKGRPVAAAAVRRAVELLAWRRELRVLLNPADLDIVEACLPDLKRQFSDLGRISLEAGPDVERGGCVVSTKEGAVDAGIAAQLAEIERGLLG